MGGASKIVRPVFGESVKFFGTNYGDRKVKIVFTAQIKNLWNYQIHIILKSTYNFHMNKLKKYTIVGILFVIIAGTIAHFVYQWSGNNFFVGLFFPVNESVWEHMKLVYFPMLLYGIFMNHQLKEEYPAVTFALSFGILVGTFLVPVIFYTYSGILGKSVMVLDIATFVLSVMLAFWAVYRLTLSGRFADERSTDCTRWLVYIAAVTGLCFLLFSYMPPDAGLFQDLASANEQEGKNRGNSGM